MSLRSILFVSFCLTITTFSSCEVDLCDSGTDQISCDEHGKENAALKYTKGHNEQWHSYISKIENAVASYSPCDGDKCSCHYALIKKDLALFKEGVSKDAIQAARERGIFYQIIDKKLYREKDCMFPSRCSGIEYFILKIIEGLPNMEMVINTRDWPQVHHRFGEKKPVFSFSKTSDYLDITYPAWTFWEGGPAISLYPVGIGRWDLLRKKLTDAAEQWSWKKKNPVAFFRGSRTSSERDPLIYLSRDEPHLVDAQYTKNQAWKSDADTLYAPPASEVALEDHCRYKYLFNFRGVAASFRFKHLFLCGSLVFHVGDEWTEFFYHTMKPWVHYIPVKADATKEEIGNLLAFAIENDVIVSKIAERGRAFIKDHLRMKDVLCYWRKLLRSYARLLNFDPQQEENLKEIRPKL